MGKYATVQNLDLVTKYTCSEESSHSLSFSVLSNMSMSNGSWSLSNLSLN